MKKIPFFHSKTLTISLFENQDLEWYKSYDVNNKNSASAEVADRTRADGVIFPTPHHFNGG